MIRRATHPQLRAFALSGDEEAFADVVAEFGGLVYSGALRRTGERELAEEVAQNVFAIAARKAGALAVHPALTGWFYATVRLEAAKGLRARRRHRRRSEALAEELKTETPMMDDDEQELWAEAVPLLDEALDRLRPDERQVLLGRFFEERRFAEIAAETGSSEAACKMRLKRALEKLRRWLSGRGVRVSAGVLSAGLAVEFSKAMPAAVAVALPGKALAVSGAMNGFTILTNTLSTMSPMKSVCVAVAGVLLVGGVPAVVQGLQVGELRARAAVIEEERVVRRGAAVDDPRGPMRADAPVDALLRQLRRPVSAEMLVAGQSAWSMIPDYGKSIRVNLSVAMMGAGARARLVEEIQNHPSAPWMGEQLTAIKAMGGGGGGGGVAEELDRKLEDGVGAGIVGADLEQWAAEEPDAAIAWFEAKRAGEALLGKGTRSSDAEGELRCALFCGVFAADWEKAMGLLDGAVAAERRVILKDAALGLSRGDADQLVRLRGWIAGLGVPEERAAAAEGGAGGVGLLSGLDEAAAFVGGCRLDVGSKARLLAELVELGDFSWGEKFDWAAEQMGDEGRDALVEQIVGHGVRNDGGGLGDWIDERTEGVERDAWLVLEIEALVAAGKEGRALERLDGIADDEVKAALALDVLAGAAAQTAEEIGIDLEREVER